MSHIYQELTLKIQKLRDIAEEESNLLHDMFMPLVSHAQTHLLSSSLHYRLPSTLRSRLDKFEKLLHILKMSMADIMSAYSASKLLEFEAEELVYLIKALFADSDLRERNLRELSRYAF